MTATRLLTLALIALVGVTLLAAPAAAQSMTDGDDASGNETMMNGGSMTTTESTNGSSMDDGSMMTTESMDDGSMMTTESMNGGSMDDGSMDQSMTESMNGGSMADGSMDQNMTDTAMSEEMTETEMNEETTESSGAATDSGTTSGTGPGFTVALALIALAGIGLLAARRRA